MTVDELLDKLDEILEKSWNFPLSGGKSMVDAEAAKAVLEDIRINMPAEIKQARAIVADRGDIIKTARREAESIIRSAEERQKAMIAQEEVVRNAQLKANDILTNAQTKSREMRRAGADFVDDLMRRTEETLAGSLNDVRKTRQSIKSPRSGEEL